MRTIASLLSRTITTTLAGSIRLMVCLLRALTPLYVKTLVQAAWMISWRARKSVMTRW